MDREDPGDVFAIPDLYASSRLFWNLDGDGDDLFSELKLDEISGNLPLPEPFQPRKLPNDFFSIPDLVLGDNEPISSLSSVPSLTEEISVDLFQEAVPQADDIWRFAHEEEIKAANFLTWQAFDLQIEEVVRTPYATEAGPQVFDAAVAEDPSLLGVNNKDAPLLPASLYASSLLALGLCRSSILFVWNEDQRMFECAVESPRVAGCTVELLGRVTKIFLSCGNLTNGLQWFADQSYKKQTTPAKAALADMVLTVLQVIQTRVDVPARSLDSILQLTSSFTPVERVLRTFYSMVKAVETAQTDEEMISIIFKMAEKMEHGSDRMQSVFIELVRGISRPFVDFIEEWIGLRAESGVPLVRGVNGKSFVSAANRSWIDDQGTEVSSPDFVLDSACVPSFLPLEDAELIFETGRNLRFLREYHPGHVLAKPDVIAAANPPRLEWDLSWEYIESIQDSALAYEDDLTAAIKHCRDTTITMDIDVHGADVAPSPWQLYNFGKSQDSMEAHVLEPIPSLGTMVKSNTEEPMSKVVSFMLSPRNMYDEPSDSTAVDFPPPLSLSASLCFRPLIEAQSRIINIATLRLLFDSHKLRQHLDIQAQFHLLVNGIFSSRLSHALFDPTLETAERQKGVAKTGGVMGLRLGGRDTWPPASSELRLALMGLLAESYRSPDAPSKTTSSKATYLDSSPALPGDFSFSVRAMSAAEIEKVLNPDGIEALDFLRLSYKPPTALEPVITPVILWKYDQLFRLLLRVLRMLFITNTLFRESMTDRRQRRGWGQGDADVVQRKFAWEARHFVSSVAAYFREVIDEVWKKFEDRLEDIEQTVSRDDAHVTHWDGLDGLRAYHEKVLDRILFSVLLRKRQAPVMKLLEEIFNIVLQFHKQRRESEDVAKLYRRFHEQVGVFVTVCKGLAEKKGFSAQGTEDDRKAAKGLFGAKELDGGENEIMRLVTMLDASGYYSVEGRA